MFPHLFPRPFSKLLTVTSGLRCTLACSFSGISPTPKLFCASFKGPFLSLDSPFLCGSHSFPQLVSLLVIFSFDLGPQTTTRSSRSLPNFFLFFTQGSGIPFLIFVSFDCLVASSRCSGLPRIVLWPIVLFSSLRASIYRK